VLEKILWPTEFKLRVEWIDLCEDRLIVSACGTQEQAICPDCRALSERINSYYCRRPNDLPCGGYPIQLHLSVPRFFCDNENCPRRTFAAPFPEMLPRYAHRTRRLATQQEGIGHAIGGEAGCRLTRLLGLATSADTLLGMVRSVPETETDTPRVLGVDDWAKRKGQRYGTILVDLEKRRVVDLLDDRSADSFSDWLKKHPGVEIIARDRGAEYIEGATTGAPDAIQIADRFHLLQNLVAVLKRVLDKQPKTLRQAAREVRNDLLEEAGRSQETVEPDPIAGQVDKKPPSLHELRFDEVKAYQRQDWSQMAIARYLDLDRRTVSKYFELDRLPDRAPVPQSTSTVTPYLAYLTQRWYEGCQNIKQLHDELTAKGFTGHYSSVWRTAKQLLATGQVSYSSPTPAVPIPNLSVTTAVWLLIHPDDRLDELECKLRDKLCTLSEEIRTARTLALDFREMIRERLAERLDTWLQAAEQSGIQPFKNFVVSLRRDYEAIKAALLYPWSTGQPSMSG